MFDYLKNRYNPNPTLFCSSELCPGYLYVKYTDAPFLDLPSSIEGFKALHKRKFWYNIKRSARLFRQEIGVLQFSILRDQKEIEKFIGQVFVLFNQRWKNEYTSSTWKSECGFDRYKEALIELSKSENAFLAVLYTEGNKLLSYGYCLVDNNIIYFYQHAACVEPTYRKYSLGKLMLYYLLKYAVKNKYDRFDFMSGISPYKSEWTNSVRPIYSYVGKKNLRGYIKSQIIRFRFFLQFNPFARYVIKGILNRMVVRHGK